MSEKQTKESAPLTEELLKKKEADLKTQSEKLAQDRKDFEKEKEDFEKSKGLAKESKLVTDFDFEGDSYSFSEKAPEIINFAGQKFSRQELVDNEEVLLQFIGGRSTLIIKN